MVEASKVAWAKRKANGWQPKPKSERSPQIKSSTPRVRKPDKIEGTFTCPRCSVEFQPKRKSQSLCSRKCARVTNAVAAKKLFLTYDELYELYWTREMTCREIGEIYDVKQPTVEALMRKLAVPKRTLSEAVKLSKKKQIEVDKHSKMLI